MVMSWLLGSMIPEISDDFILYDTATEIWNAAAEMYSKRDNTAELYELEAQIQDIKQGDNLVNRYYSQLSRIWKQIDAFESLRLSSTADEQLFKAFIEQKRLFKFLTGLHKNFDAVRSRILGTKPLPNLKIAFSEVRQEESRIKVMLGSSSLQNSEETVFLSAKPKGDFLMQTQNQEHITGLTSRQESSHQPAIQSSNKNLYCKFCHKTGHTISNCYRKNGFPNKGKTYSDGRQGQASYHGRNSRHSNQGGRPVASPAKCEGENSTENPIQGQLNQILSLLNLQQPQGTPAIQASMVCSGNSSNNSSSVWIVDSGATNHMMFNRELLYFRNNSISVCGSDNRNGVNKPK